MFDSTSERKISYPKSHTRYNAYIYDAWKCY